MKMHFAKRTKQQRKATATEQQQRKTAKKNVLYMARVGGNFHEPKKISEKKINFSKKLHPHTGKRNCDCNCNSSFFYLLKSIRE